MMTTRTRYCLRLMIDLARQAHAGNPVSLSEISARSGISRRYLEQLAVLLRNAGLVQSQPGRKGGYVLAREAGEIDVADIVTAASGPIRFVECEDSASYCMNREFCECRPVWILASRAVKGILHNYSLADLADPEQMAALRQRVNSMEQGASPDSSMVGE